MRGTPVAKLLEKNGLGCHIQTFYTKNVHTLEEAAKLTLDELESSGAFSYAEASTLKLLFEPEHSKTVLGRLLLANGLEQYSKQFYDDGVYDVAPLTMKQIADIGVVDEQDQQRICALLGGNSFNEGLEYNTDAVQEYFSSALQEVEKTGIHKRFHPKDVPIKDAAVLGRKRQGAPLTQEGTGEKSLKTTMVYNVSETDVDERNEENASQRSCMKSNTAHVLDPEAAATGRAPLYKHLMDIL